MRKFILMAAVFVAGISYAQETEETTTVSAFLRAGSEATQLGLTVEFGAGEYSGKYYSFIVNGAWAAMDYEAGYFGVTGSGTVTDFGLRTYYSKKLTNEGFYTSNYLTYGSYEFDETIMVGSETQKFEGKYRYFSFFHPEIGYKFEWGGFSLDPFLGAMWKIEIKGKGDVDNNLTDEWLVNGGLRLGYEF